MAKTRLQKLLDRKRKTPEDWEQILKNSDLDVDRGHSSYDFNRMAQSEILNVKGDAVEYEQRVSTLEREVIKYMQSKKYSAMDIIIMVERFINGDTLQMISRKYGYSIGVINYNAGLLINKSRTDMGLRDVVTKLQKMNGDLNVNGT